MQIVPTLLHVDASLVPLVSANTISFQYGKYHNAYVDNLNKVIKETDYEHVLEINSRWNGGQTRQSNPLQQRHTEWESSILLEQTQKQWRG